MERNVVHIEEFAVSSEDNVQFAEKKKKNPKKKEIVRIVIYFPVEVGCFIMTSRMP